MKLCAHFKSRKSAVCSRPSYTAAFIISRFAQRVDADDSLYRAAADSPAAKVIECVRLKSAIRASRRILCDFSLLLLYCLCNISPTNCWCVFPLIAADDYVIPYNYIVKRKFYLNYFKQFFSSYHSVFFACYCMYSCRATQILMHHPTLTLKSCLKRVQYTIRR